MRKRPQVAEAKVAELEAKGQQTEAIPDEGIDDVLGDPDELVDGRTVAKLVKKGIDDYKNSVDAQTASTQTEQKRKIALDESFEQARQDFTDFDQVTGQAIDSGWITDEERVSIAASANPAALLYAKSVERRDILKPNPASGSDQANNNNNELLDPEKETVIEQESDIGIYEALNG
jgi:hypothetical protein